MKRSTSIPASCLAVAAIGLAACGSDAPAWETAYRERLDANYIDLDPDGCEYLDSLLPERDDATLSRLLGATDGETIFGQVMADLDLSPTADQQNTADQIHLDTVNRECGW